jgi:hypothetical protein
MHAISSSQRDDDDPPDIPKLSVIHRDTDPVQTRVNVSKEHVH